MLQRVMKLDTPKSMTNMLKTPQPFSKIFVQSTFCSLPRLLNSDCCCFSAGQVTDLPRCLDYVMYLLHNVLCMYVCMIVWP